MKSYLTTLAVVALSGMMSVTVHAQEPVWLKQFGDNNINRGLQLTYDGAGAIYGVGRVGGPAMELDDTTVTVLGAEDIFLIKLDTAGAVVWARTAGGACGPAESEGGGKIVHDVLSGQVVIAGQFSCQTTFFGDHVLNGSQSGGGKDQFIAAYDDAGECLWARSASGFDLHLIDLMVDGASQLFAFGGVRTAPAFFLGSPNIMVPPGGFIAKYASDGTLLDAQRVVVNGELGRAAWVGSDAWILTGLAKPNATLYDEPLTVHSTQQDGFVARTDTTGEIEWVTMFPSNGYAFVFRTAVLPDGRIAVSGLFREDLVLPQDTLYGDPGVSTFFVAVLSPEGEIQWAMPFSAEGGAYINDIRIDTNGDINLYGRYVGSLALDGEPLLVAYGSNSGFVARLSPTGQVLAAWNFGRTVFGNGSILPTDHGIYLATQFDSTLVLGSQVLAGSSAGVDTGPFADLFIARFDSLSGFTSVPTLKASHLERLHIYANPNNGLCTIELPAAVKPGSDLLLTIHDAMGRVVQQAPLRWSEGTIQLDIRAQAKGIYYAELLDGKQRYSGTIVFE
jgi:hypothetical protein